jgi:hypothetical protein
VAVNVPEEPAQMVIGVAATVGKGLTVTVTVVVFVQPEADVPETVYVVVEAGLAVTEAPVVALNPVDGAHEYVLPPEAVNVPDNPEQIEIGEEAIVGNGLTVIVAIAVLEQPEEVPVTV